MRSGTCSTWPRGSRPSKKDSLHGALRLIDQTNLELQEDSARGFAWHVKAHGIYQKKQRAHTFRGCRCSPRCVFTISRVQGVLLLQKAISPQCPCVKLVTRHTKVLAKRIVRAEQQGTAVAAASIRRSQHAGAGQMAKSEPIVVAAAALTIQPQPLPPAQPPPAHPPPPPPQPADGAAVAVWMDPDDEDEVRDMAGRLGLGLGVTDDIEMRRQSLEGLV